MTANDRKRGKGVVEEEFDTMGALINRYAARPDGGVIMIYSDVPKFINSFAPDGIRESSVVLERPPVPFFPSQLAVFRSGEILVSGVQYRPYKASTAIFDPTSHLVKQLVLDGDVAIENAIAQDTYAQQFVRPMCKCTTFSKISIIVKWCSNANGRKREFLTNQ